MTGELLAGAEWIAENVLFPAALQVDAGETDLVGHLDLLAERGFYGLAAPPGVGSLTVPSLAAACRVIEMFAGGCLTTAFVWAQHHGAVLTVAASERPGVRDGWLAQLADGRRRAGIAIGSAMRPGPPALRATAVDGGYLFDGEAPWVTGWGLIDTLSTAARDPQDAVVWALLDAAESETLRVEPLEMVAVRSSRTVLVVFERHFVSTDRVTGVAPHEVWTQPNPGALRFNGSLTLGVAGRCARLAADTTLLSQVDGCRDALDDAAPDMMPSARAAAAELALRAAAALSVCTGSAAVLPGTDAHRLMREAMFLLVFGLRPAIKDALLTTLRQAPDGHTRPTPVTAGAPAAAQ